jgi:hypothetical protein
MPATQLNMDFAVADYAFDGATYSPVFDYERLAGQNRKVYDLMVDGKWRTLNEIETGIRDLDPQARISQASASARLRDLRKERFGGHTVNRRPRGERSAGLFEYQLILHSLDS